MPEDVTTLLIRYIEEHLVPADLTERISETSPLLEMGVLDSLKTAMLLNYIREELGVRVPPLRIEYQNFRDVRSISALVADLTAPAGEDGR